MTSLPDWLVERAALDEVAPASRDRLHQADPQQLAARVAAIHADNAAELAAHPVAPAVALIEDRVRAEVHRRAMRQRQRRLGSITAAASIAVAVVVGVVVATGRPDHAPPPRVATVDDGTRVKGPTRLLAFRQHDDQVEQLEQDALVRAGELIQLRYHPGGQAYGVIASIDGVGVVTLHHPVSEDAPREATALATKTTALPNAYALDDAPRFERFFFITADEPIDVPYSLAALRSLAHRTDSASAALELPAGLRQWSLRLRKPDPTQKAPTP